jgi:UDP-N-acetylglucosamine 3-dehydrogenase
MSDKNVMKVGIVGCGKVAKGIHIPALLRAEGVEIAAVCDVDEGEAKKTAKMFDIDRSYTDLSEMLKQEELEMMDICTPPQMHAQMSIQAIEEGCHVLLEKPMTTSVSEANKILRSLKGSGVKLCVVHNYLFKPVAIKAKSIMERGELGDIIGMDVKFQDSSDRTPYWNKDHWCHTLPGGRFGENIIHPLYLIDKFLNISDVVAVHAKKLSNYDWVSIDELRVLLDAKNSMATISMSGNSPRDVTTVDIYGTKMNLHLDFSTFSIIKYKPKRYSPNKYYLYFLHNLDNMIVSSKIFAGAISHAISYPLKSSTRKKYIRFGHYYIIQRFIESIQDNNMSPVTGEEGRKIVALQEKIFKQICQE